jgi:Co/Zn/Cd efflux system component
MKQMRSVDDDDDDDMGIVLSNDNIGSNATNCNSSLNPKVDVENGASTLNDDKKNDRTGDSIESSSNRNSPTNRRICCSQKCIQNLLLLSNEGLLSVAFLSFLSFAIIQMIFAVCIVHSQAMLGDSSVMIIDAITYLCNGLSERRKKFYQKRYMEQKQQLIQQATGKQQHEEQNVSIHDNTTGTTSHENRIDDNDDVVRNQSSNETTSCTLKGENNTVDVMISKEQCEELIRMQIQFRKSIVQLEAIAPIVSVTALIIITAMIARRAILTLEQTISIHNQNASNDDDDDQSMDAATAQQQPNLYIILSFSVVNLLLDALNMFYFTRSKALSSYICCRRLRRPPTTPTTIINDDDDDDDDNLNHRTDINMDTSTSKKEIKLNDDDEICESNSNYQCTHHHNHHALRKSHRYNNSGSNLNMCSAYTHVLADTLRSVAVIAAVVFALIFDIEPTIADSTATIIVSLLIAISLIPLLQGLYKKLYELYILRQAEHALISICTTTTTINTTTQ